jgi:predicted membrane protein
MTRVIFGLIFLLIGVSILLDNILLIDIPNLWDFWPSLVIIFGLKNLFENLEQPIWSLFTIAVGVLLQLITLDILDGSIIGTLFWPVIFIGIGLSILVNKSDKNTTYTSFTETKKGTPSKEGKKVSESSESTFEITRIFSSEKKKITSKKFSRGDITIFAGEVTLEFTDAKLANEVVNLDETVIFGSLILRVPENIAIETSVTSVFGDIEDRRDRDRIDPEASSILIKGSIIFGNIEIRSS